MIDLNWYQSFLAVYRAGTVSRAAEERFLTQPAVSQHLAALEAAVGQPLFHRLPRRMVPTERGKELYSQIAQALDTLKRTSQTLRGTATEHAVIRMGTPPEFFGEVALERLAQLNLRLSVRFGVPHDLIPLLEQGQLDIVIATQQLPAMAITYRTLAHEQFILVGGNQQHSSVPVLERSVALAMVEQVLAEQRWISYGAELPIIRRFWQQSFGTRPPIQPTTIIPDLRALVKAVESGYGISVLPEYLCRTALLAGRLRVLWEPPQPVMNELWVATRRSDGTNVTVQQVYMALQANGQPM